MRKYPVGIQSFKELREGNFIYVDKTRLIHTLIESGKYFFLSRPRRFGKSLLISTIKEIFSGTRDLFKGLWIEDKWNLALTRLGVDIRSEAHSAHGRCDVIVQTSAYIYAIELKLNGTAQQALDQIIEKKYLHPFQSDTRKKYAIGINFSGEKRAVDDYLMKEIL